jgi:tetratricopeptide (TPR) repeat protein
MAQRPAVESLLKTRQHRETFLQAGEVSILLYKGLEYHRAGRLEDAHECYRRVLAVDPTHADALNLLGTIAGERNRFAKAVDFFDRAIRRKPREPVYRNNLGNTLIKAKEYDLAVEQLEEAVRLKPDYVDAWCNLAVAYSASGELDEARQVLQKVRTIDPKNKRMPLLLAQLEARSGMSDRAVDYFRQVFASRPSLAALQGILLSQKVTPDMPEIAEAERILRDGELSTVQRSSLLHALAKAYDDIGRHEEAFEQAIIGKKLEDSTFDLDRHLDWVKKTRSVFDEQFFREKANFGNQSEIPVFIVGMPRSGTTLVEQIIASHPRAHGAGELPHLKRVAGAVGARLPGPAMDEQALRTLSRNRIAELAEVYLLRLTKSSSNPARVCDKAPLNGFYLGVATLLFPRSKILYCRRNAIDTCVSIFMQKFASVHAYSYDLKTLGRYYGSFAELMDHWLQLFPESIREIKYEDTVADVEKQARGIIDFLGLEWNDACLQFQKTERAVMTASKWQVRQPVYTSSVHKWRRYEKHLKPLIEGLGKHASEAGYEER